MIDVIGVVCMLVGLIEEKIEKEYFGLNLG